MIGSQETVVMRDQFYLFDLGGYTVNTVELELALDEGFYRGVICQHLLDLRADQEELQDC